MRIINSPNDTKVIEVAPTTGGAERLFKWDYHVANVLSVPQRTEDHIGKSEEHETVRKYPVMIIISHSNYVIGREIAHIWSCWRKVI